MIELSVAKIKMFSPVSEIFLWIKPNKKKNIFCGKFGSMLTFVLEVCEKARNVFLDKPTSVWPQGVTQHRIFIKFFFYFTWIFLLFLLVFRNSNFWSLRNLIKQLFHSRFLVMANSALRASLPTTRAQGIIVKYSTKPSHRLVYFKSITPNLPIINALRFLPVSFNCYLNLDYADLAGHYIFYGMGKFRLII